MSDVKIAVMGAAGRMGRELIKAVVSQPGCVLSGGIERAGASAIGEDLGALAGVGPLGVKVSSDALELIARSDAILDFTSPGATVEFAGLAANARNVHVVGTTGLSEDDEAAIRAAGRHATIVMAGNMSLGIALLSELTRRVAAALDHDFDIEILEMHHKYKVDAPSGTALMLGNAAAAGREVSLKERTAPARAGHTGSRKAGDIGFASLRGGDIIGDHTVIFAGPGERIELSHRATDRSIFARGAVKAAMWGCKKASPGVYTMADVLGLCR